MKTLATLSFVFASLVAMAQTVEIPAKEFTVNISETNLSVKAGETKQVTVTLLKSKSYSKEKVSMSVSNVIPQGITVQFDEQEGKFDSSVATINVGSTVSPGTYQLILSGTINHKTKGSILKVSVGNDNVASK